MNIRLLRIYSVPIRISSPELHVSDTCFLHEINIMGRYVTTTYRLHKLHVNVLVDTYLLRIHKYKLMNK